MSTPTHSEIMSAAAKSAELEVKVQTLMARAAATNAEIQQMQLQLQLAEAVRNGNTSEEQLAAYRRSVSESTRASPTTAPELRPDPHVAILHLCLYCNSTSLSLLLKDSNIRNQK
jgi:hypothetical protein